MPVIRLETFINAPVNVCFDLARSIDLHLYSMKDSGEIAVGGVVSGLIEEGQTVTWKAKHAGITQYLTSKITLMSRPWYFRDEMVKGIFQSLAHDHIFEFSGSFTIMRDNFEFESPLGVLGKMANRLWLTEYLTNVLNHRNSMIKSIAESDLRKKFLKEEI